MLQALRQRDEDRKLKIFFCLLYKKYRCLWNTNAPFPQLIENRLDIWPTNLNNDRDHLLIKDNLPTKFEASGANRS